MKPPDVVQGRSLAPQIRGERVPAVSAFASHEERFHVVRLGDGKLHSSATGEPSFYDLASDPEEISEQGRNAKQDVARLQQELDQWLDQEEALRSRVARGEVRELSPEALEELRELGDIEGAMTRRSDPLSRVAARIGKERWHFASSSSRPHPSSSPSSRRS